LVRYFERSNPSFLALYRRGAPTEEVYVGRGIWETVPAEGHSFLESPVSWIAHGFIFKTINGVRRLEYYSRTGNFLVEGLDDVTQINIAGDHNLEHFKGFTGLKEGKRLLYLIGYGVGLSPTVALPVLDITNQPLENINSLTSYAGFVFITLNDQLYAWRAVRDNSNAGTGWLRGPDYYHIFGNTPGEWRPVVGIERLYHLGGTGVGHCASGSSYIVAQMR